MSILTISEELAHIYSNLINNILGKLAEKRGRKTMGLIVIYL